MRRPKAEEKREFDQFVEAVDADARSYLEGLRNEVLEIEIEGETQRAESAEMVFGYNRALRLLQVLRSLSERTRPAGGKLSARHKDGAAQLALDAGRLLFFEVAQWAVAHRIGLILDGPEIGIDDVAMDDHKFERIGGSLLAVELPTDRQPEDWEKRAIASVLIPHSPFPQWLGNAVADALFDLNLGRFPSLFSLVGKKQASMEETRIQLSALAMVRYRRSRYHESADEAETKIASALGVGVKTLQKWRTKTFGGDRMPDILKGASLRADLTALRARDDAEALADADAQYGDPALVDLAQRFKKARTERSKAKRAEKPPRRPLKAIETDPK